MNNMSNKYFLKSALLKTFYYSNPVIDINKDISINSRLNDIIDYNEVDKFKDL